MAFAAVQRVGKGQATGATLTIGSGDGWATPTAGNLLVCTANSDATVSMTTSGFTLGPSVIDGNGTYLWYKVAAGTESTITFTPGASTDIVGTACEYSGNTSSPFDVSNSSTIAGSSGTTTTSVSVTTTGANHLVVAAALLHAGSGAIPTSPSWTNSFTNRLSPGSGASGPDSRCYTFFADLLDAGAAGAKSTSCSWTNARFDRQQLVAAFKVSTVAAGSPPGRRRPQTGALIQI